ncbi:MAG: hypothetical protein JWO12_3480, partial [Frankiales bacterium]|nr:hypothetical protein [Frankiales bacterium]
VASPGPTSLELPAEDVEQAFDTGSDAWWRQQAEAQRRAAETETPPAAEPPPPPVDPAAPPAPSPLDRDWLPADLAALRPPEAPEPATALPTADTTAESLATPAATEPESVPAQEPPVLRPRARMAERPRPPVDDLPQVPHVPLTRAPHEGERVGPARAVAGALLAVAGVGLGVGALLLYGNDEPRGGPVIDARPTVSTASTASVPASASAAAGPTTPPAASSPPPATAGPTSTAVAVAPVQPAVAPKAPVDVLNNSKIKGLADRGAARFRAGGWSVPLTGNYRGGTIARTTIYFAPGQRPSAERFAKQFGIPRVLPRFAGLPGSGLTVVLTRDYR